MLVSTCDFVIIISYTSYIAIEVIHTMSLYIIATVNLTGPYGIVLLGIAFDCMAVHGHEFLSICTYVVSCTQHAIFKCLLSEIDSTCIAMQISVFLFQMPQ